MPPDFQDLWLSKCDLIQVNATQQLYHAGDGPGSLYGVADGRVEIHLQERGLASSLVYLEGPGFWVGGLGVVGERRIVGVTARSKSYVFRMMRAQLQILGAESASAGRALTMILMENLTTAINVIDALKREEPMTRLAAMLANLLGDLPKEESLIRASQTDLASLTNLSRATVNTALAHLESARILTRSYGSVTITNASRLLKLTGRA